MTKEETIRYLQQIQWLNEKRTEAIGMAINLLREESVHVTIGEPKEATGVLGAMIKEAEFKEWHKQQMHDKVINNYVECTVKKDSDGLFTTETWDDVNNLLNKIGAKEGDKVKLVIIKED